MDLQSGDPFGVKGDGILGWASRTFTGPCTNMVHFGILWQELPDGDWLILESVAKGLSVGKLSWYDSGKLEFYRVDCPEDLRHQAPWGLVDWGRSHYDYLLLAKITLGGIQAFFKILITERKIRKLRAEDFPYGINSSLICTEAVDVAYDSVGVNLIPEGILPIPSAFKQAELDGRMSKITE